MFSARFMCAVCNKCVLIGTNSVACWYPLQTVWTQIRPDKKLGLIWIRTVWHSYWWYPSKTFWKEFILSKATACEKKPVQLFSMQKVQPVTYQPQGCRLLLLPPCCFRYLILNECARSSGPSLLAYVTFTKLSWTGPKILVWAFIYTPSLLGIRCSLR